MSVNIFQNNALKKIAGNYAIDSSLSATSENAVMNKVVTAALGAVGVGVIGTQAEIEGKIQRGEIAPGSIVQITDDAADTITGLQVTTSAVPGQTTVEGALSTINTHLSGLDTEVDSKLDAIKVLFTNTTQINIGGGPGDIFFNIRISPTYIMQVEFNYQQGISLNVSTDNGASWTTYWRK